MLFNSIHFLIFFPIVVLLYFAIPQKFKNIWLLIASYYFYMNWNAKYALLLLFSTVVTYVASLIIAMGKHRKAGLVLCIVANLGILGLFKYLDFALYNINGLLKVLHMQTIEASFSLVLPVGISFYTFQALGYTIDVYRENIQPEKNFLQYALFVSFFPQLVAGPIERSGHLLKQIQTGTTFQYEKAKNGLMLMMWGLFEKLAIADQLAVLVDTVYDEYDKFGGASIVFATCLFAIQIYCDFGGYSHIAIGASQVLGFELMNNFRQPYFAVSVKDFWNRWHISLSTWLRDYVYIPLGGSHCSKAQKCRNLMLTFLVSGFWHGANWHYVLWGAVHGVYRVIGELNIKWHLSEKNRITLSLKKISTFLLVSAAWFLFRINGLRDGMEMIKKVLMEPAFLELFKTEIWDMGLSKIGLVMSFAAILVLWLVDFLHEKGIAIRKMYGQQVIVIRWFGYLVAALVLSIYMIQDFGAAASNFIYFQF